ncbi:hypothetical protein ACLKA6_008051 [Drosophila palustris]
MDCTVRTNCMPPNQSKSAPTNHQPPTNADLKTTAIYSDPQWVCCSTSWSLAIIASCNDCKHNLAMLIFRLKSRPKSRLESQAALSARR